MLAVRYADALALSFEKTARIEAVHLSDKVVVTGNPVRDRVHTACRTCPHAPFGAGDPINIRWSSAAARGRDAFGELVPPAIALRAHGFALAAATGAAGAGRRTHGSGCSRPTFRQSKVNVDLAPFFADLPEKHGATSHLVISRSGAGSTGIAELYVIGRPAISVTACRARSMPDQKEQRAGARSGRGRVDRRAGVADAGNMGRAAAVAVRRAGNVLPKPQPVAKSLGRPDAVALLADLAEKLAAGRMPAEKVGSTRMKMPRNIGPVHFVGIGGIGIVSGIAEHPAQPELQACAAPTVARSAPNVQRLRDMGIDVEVGQKPENLKDAAVVVVSSAIKRDNPELQVAARARGLPIVRRAWPRCWPKSCGSRTRSPLAERTARPRPRR